MTALRGLILGRPRFFFRIDQVFLQAEHCRRRPPNRRTLHPQQGDFACRATIHPDHHSPAALLRRKTGLYLEPLQQSFFTHPQFATSKLERRGGRHTLPTAFTEHGALMAASVLNSPKAVEMSIQVVRAFVRLRHLLASHHQLAAKLDELERKIATHDSHLVALFDRRPKSDGHSGEAQAADRFSDQG